MKARIVVLDLEFSSGQTGEALALIGQMIAGQTAQLYPESEPAEVPAPPPAIVAHKQIAQAAEPAVDPESQPVATAEPEKPQLTPAMLRQGSPKAPVSEIDWPEIFAQDAEIARLVADIQHGKSRWSLLEKSQKFKLFTAVMRRLMQDRTPTLKDFDRHRPNWMPTSGAFIKLYGQTSWARVLEILTEKHQPALNGHSHEPRRSL